MRSDGLSTLRRENAICTDLGGQKAGELLKEPGRRKIKGLILTDDKGIEIRP